MLSDCVSHSLISSTRTICVLYLKGQHERKVETKLSWIFCLLLVPAKKILYQDPCIVSYVNGSAYAKNSWQYLRITFLDLLLFFLEWVLNIKLVVRPQIETTTNWILNNKSGWEHNLGRGEIRDGQAWKAGEEPGKTMPLQNLHVRPRFKRKNFFKIFSNYWSNNNAQSSGP